MEKNKKQVAKIAIFITSIFIIFLSISYAFINLTLEGTKRQVIEAGILNLVLDEDENNLTIENALPMYDEVGMLQEAFTFRLINNGTTGANYKLMLTEIGTGTLEKSDVKYGLVKDGVKTIGLLSELDENGVIDSGTIGASPETIEYELRLWIDDSVTDNSTLVGKSLSYRVDVEVGQIVENEPEESCPVLAETTPNAPRLTSGMIAVTYNEADKTWVKADSTKTDWYDYSNQIWANAVTVTEETRDNYMSLGVGEPISMDDINTMWVWIPRYSYTIKQKYGRSEEKCSELGEITVSSPSNCRKVNYPEELKQQVRSGFEGASDEEIIATYNQFGFDVSSFEELIDLFIEHGEFEDTRELVETYPNNTLNTSQNAPGAIDVKFISKSQKDNGTGQCEKCAENWVTPEGFTFGGEELSGYWVGKFETGGEIVNVTGVSMVKGSAYCTSEECLAGNLIVKPNVEALDNRNVASSFYASRSMQNSTNASKYGFDVIGTGTMDVHMAKNSEWGIVSYLSQSKYGKFGNSNYDGANKEVYQNKSANYITGMSNGAASSATTNAQVAYDTPSVGYGASTTGTIYGVYDMSGGAYEYVMASYDMIEGWDKLNGGPGFCEEGGPTPCANWPNEKYFDLYTSEIASEVYKFGDATYETSSWYLDARAFFLQGNPFLLRGGSIQEDSSAGIFYFGRSSGDSAGFRLVIKP